MIQDWEETVTKVTYEREIFYGHLQELDRLQNENTQLSTIVSSLEPFVKSLNSVSQRLSPMLLAAAKDREQNQVMRDLMNKISGIESDSSKRLEAIQELEYRLKT
ncbi:hypothetical protein LOD99_3765 [Oopsacas minuta]|uniref:Uncharacterized protein n=1 Tax=Oopsacas minuta TaxID=111878 RepID=A0AAV7JXQ0_9METZ|nr:hypothetical protein LOD99_3765 [Oopsacas minuta]